MSCTNDRAPVKSIICAKFSVPRKRYKLERIGIVFKTVDGGLSVQFLAERKTMFNTNWDFVTCNHCNRYMLRKPFDYWRGPLPQVFYDQLRRFSQVKPDLPDSHVRQQLFNLRYGGVRQTLRRIAYGLAPLLPNCYLLLHIASFLLPSDCAINEKVRYELLLRTKNDTDKNWPFYRCGRKDLKNHKQHLDDTDETKRMLDDDLETAKETRALQINL